MGMSEVPRPLLSSTPLNVKRSAPSRISKSTRRQRLEIPGPHSYSTLDLDVTGTSSACTSTSRQGAQILNSVIGNPFSVCGETQPSSDIEEDSDTDSDTDCDDDFDVRSDSIVGEMCKTDSEDNDSEVESVSDVDSDDDQATLTMVEDLFPDDEPEFLSLSAYSNSSFGNPQPTCTSTINHQPQSSPQNTSGNNIDCTIEEKSSEVKQAIKNSFSNLTSKTGLDDLIDLHGRKRVFVSIEKLVELKGDSCHSTVDGKVCMAKLEFNTKRVGTRVDIEWKCGKGHGGKWESSEVLACNRYSKVYANDSLLSIALILSGNNFGKFNLFCKALNLMSVSKTTFCHFQTKCALPVVRNTWESMRTNVINIVKQYKDVCLSGDGRNDSPGHSARYCVYSLMEHCTKVVVDVEVIDKRETGGNSTTMEKEGLRRLLEKLMKEMTICEICTDASSTIIKLVREMKAKLPQLAKIFHSLDIWHKAKKLSKSLHKAAKVKNCSAFKVWIDSIVNHFWHCSQVSNRDIEKLKTTWEGVLHHVCGEHTWAGSSCSHGPEAEADTSKPPLSKSSKAMEALRKIILDVKWLKTLHFYVRFRHTGELENFNSMMTKYAPKRIAFEYPYFIMRVLLAAIDHNFHLFRNPKLTSQGKLSGHRKYSKRTQKYHAEIVKEDKGYDYFPNMAAKMLENRRSFEGSFQSKADVHEFHPNQIAPTINEGSIKV